MATSRKRRLRKPIPQHTTGTEPPPKGNQGGGSGNGNNGGGTSPAPTSPGGSTGTSSGGSTAAEQKAKEKAAKEKAKQKRLEKLERAGDIKDYLSIAEEKGYNLTPKVRQLAKKAEKGGWSGRAFLFELERTKQGKKVKEEEATVDEASYLGILADLDLGLTPGLQSLVKLAVDKKMDQGAFEYLVKQTGEYQARYSGIPAGWSEDEYLAAEHSYYTVAKEGGYKLTQAQVVYMISNLITPEKFQTKIEAVAKVAENQDYFDEFNEVLKSYGKKPLSYQEMVAFALGTSDKEFYDLWEQAALQQTAENFGLGNNLLTKGDVERIMKTAVDRFDPASATELFASIAARIRTDIPMSQLANLGVTERDIVEMEIDPLSPKALQVAKQLEQAGLNLEAQADQDLGTIPLQQQQRKPRQATL